MQTISVSKYVYKSLWHYRWMQIPIALGVAAATAVIVGALVVGDSVRTSLRELALDRLGKIDQVLIAPRFFDQSTIKDWDTQSAIEGVILFPRSTVEKKTIDVEPKNQSKIQSP